MSHQASRQPGFQIPAARRLLTLATLAMLATPTSVLAQARTADADLPRIDVIGGVINQQPGSVGLVSREQLELLQPTSTEAALRTVAGVVIKPEEESAIVANIGIRGLSAGDYKALILEDGVPIAPGLFVGNGRYYNPRVQRMAGIEVLKGASSLRYGPNTIGGVINYKTLDPEPGLALSTRFGSFGYREAMVEAGAQSASGKAAGGLVYTRIESDGFQNKAYDTHDLMLKGSFDAGNGHSFGAKFNHYDNAANISYRGLFLDEFKRGVSRNPAPDDHYLTGRNALDLRHNWDISATLSADTVAYWSSMYRDYWRFDVHGLASAAAASWVFRDTLTGNNRAFERHGVSSRINLAHESLGMNNDAEFGLRFDREAMDNVRIRATRAQPRHGVTDREIRETATSFALYAQNRFQLSDRLAVTPGLRLEHYEQKTEDRRNNANDGSSRNTEWMPGIGATYDLPIDAQLYGSVYEAFSPAQNSDAISGGDDQRLDAERSTNYEVGIRGRLQAVNYELTVFRMEFANQIIPAISNIFVNSNGGKTLHQGWEATLAYAHESGVNMAASLTGVPDARFVGDSLSSDGSVATRGGNRVTYTPELTANLRLGYRVGGLNTALSLNRIGSQYSDAKNTRALQQNVSGFFVGHIDAYTVLDLNAHYRFSQQFSAYGAVKNLTDERYIASLRQGIYAGPSRSVEVGARYKF